MSDEQQQPKLPDLPKQPEHSGLSGERAPRKIAKPGATTQRIIIWVVVGGLGIYFIAEGAIGMLTKSR
jgi:hypothetical protein